MVKIFRLIRRFRFQEYMKYEEQIVGKSGTSVKWFKPLYYETAYEVQLYDEYEHVFTVLSRRLYIGAETLNDFSFTITDVEGESRELHVLSPHKLYVKNAAVRSETILPTGEKVPVFEFIDFRIKK